MSKTWVKTCPLGDPWEHKSHLNIAASNLFPAHSAGGNLEVTAESSIFAGFTKGLDETHSVESTRVLLEDRDEAFDGAKKLEEIVDGDGDHYVLSRKADSSNMASDSRFLRDLCLLTLSCSFFALVVRVLSKRTLDMSLGCVLGTIY